MMVMTVAMEKTAPLDPLVHPDPKDLSALQVLQAQSVKLAPRDRPG